GRLPVRTQSRWQSVTSNDPLALGLARNSGAAPRSLPGGAAQWLASDEGRHLVILDADPSLEDSWFAPLGSALRHGRIGMLSLHIPDAGLSFETIRGDLRRFWRRPRPLESYA